MAAVITEASRRVVRNRGPAIFRQSAALLALVVAISLTVGILLGSRLAVDRSTTPAGQPARDSAVVLYGEVIDRDVNLIDREYAKFICKSRADCIERLLQMKADTEALMRDMSTAPSPSQLVQTSARLKAAAQAFDDQLSSTLAVVQEPGSDFVAASNMPDIHNLDLAAAGVVCWPVSPVESESTISCD